MSFVKLYIHAVWTTKHRYPVLDEKGRTTLAKHILYNARRWDIQILNINGTSDHFHALIRMRADISVAQVIQSIKGEASWWANKMQLFERELWWAKGYYARSVDESNIGVVQEYIINQGSTLLYKTEVDGFLEINPIELF